MAAAEWSEKKKMIVTAAVGLSVNLIAGYYLYSLYNEWTDRSKENVKLQGEIKQLQGIVSEGPLKMAELEKKKLDFASKESKLPEGDKLSDLLNDISRLAAKWNCQRMSVTFQSGVPDAGKAYVKDIWRTRWTASFFDWCRFMNEMEERFPRFVAFENMNFTIANSGMIPTGAKHDISVDLVTYRYVKPKVGATP